MSLIIDSIPESVEVGGKNLPINTDFRTSILFELLMQDKTIESEDKFETTLQLYYPVEILKENKAEAITKALWFYSGGIYVKEPKKGEKSKGPTTDRRYSYEADDIYIYAAFLDQYRIDLQDEDLHWWKFRALFRSLKDDCKMSKIMSYRAMTINDKMAKAEQKFYSDMKRLYALPDDRTEEEKENDFAEMLSF